jgi:hypothetical protein
LFLIVSSAPSFPWKLQQKLYCFTLSMGFSFCTISNRYPWQRRHFWRMCWTFVCGILHSILEHCTDFCGLCTNDCSVVSTCCAFPDGLLVLLLSFAQLALVKTLVPCMN